MAGRRFKVGPRITVQLHNEEFVKLRKDPKLESIFRVRGETWVSRLNSELHAAQAARRQPVKDGYTYYVHDGGSRLRLYVVAFTARAQAHEKKHSTILKLMETTRYEVKKHADLTPEQKAASAEGAKSANEGFGER